MYDTISIKSLTIATFSIPLLLMYDDHSMNIANGVLSYLLQMIELHCMVPGHTQMRNDALFGLMKNKLKSMELFTHDEVQQGVADSSYANVPVSGNTHAYICAHAQSETHSLSHSLSRSRSRSLTQIDTHIHTHSLTYTHTHSLTVTHTLVYIYIYIYIA